jgi:hypothetical protein
LQGVLEGFMMHVALFLGWNDEPLFLLLLREAR